MSSVIIAFRSQGILNLKQYHHYISRSTSTCLSRHHSNSGPSFGNIIIRSDYGISPLRSSSIIITKQQQQKQQKLSLSSYSRMLDMGGAPSSLNDKKALNKLIDVSKNCQIQGVCFDLDVLTKSFDNDSTTTSSSSSGTSLLSSSTTATTPTTNTSTNNVIGSIITPDTTKIENITNLLKKTHPTHYNFKSYEEKTGSRLNEHCSQSFANEKQIRCQSIVY